MNETICHSLDSFLDDELDSVERDAFHEHLTDCDPCSIAITQQSNIDSHLRAYAECLVPVDPKQMQLPSKSFLSPNEPSPAKTRRYAYVLAEACAVAAIGYGIWFSLDRMARDEQVAQEPSQQVAAPPEAQAENKTPIATDKDWEKKKEDLETMREELHQEQPQLNVKVDQANSVAKYEDGSKAMASARNKRLLLKQQETLDKLKLTETKLSQIEQVAESRKDPLDALNAVNQVLRSSVESSTLMNSDQEEASAEVHLQYVPLMKQRDQAAEKVGKDHASVKQLDSQLKMLRKELVAVASENGGRFGSLKFDDVMIPLMIERNKYATEFGERHPNVIALGRQLEMMQDELKRQIRTSANGTSVSALLSSKEKTLVTRLFVQLAKVETERAKAVLQFGDNHPKVKSLDKLISLINRALADLHSRYVRLKSKAKDIDPAVHAADKVAETIDGLRLEQKRLQKQLEEIEAETKELTKAIGSSQ